MFQASDDLTLNIKVNSSASVVRSYLGTFLFYNGLMH